MSSLYLKYLKETKENEDTYYYGLRYEEFIAPMVKTIQYQQKEIERLEERISVLEEQLQK